MKKKYYAVRKGRETGVFATWDLCKKQVDGYSGAEYKSFESEEEALNYLNNIKTEVATNCLATAYTDGSYNIKNQHYSYGVVLFYNDKKYTFSEELFDAENASMRNVAGEIAGAMKAMSFCVENKISTLEIIYDYEGVEKWCTGVWKTNKSGTIAYKKYYDSISDVLSVKFTKVKGHSGDTYNDEADALAKKSLGIK